MVWDGFNMKGFQDGATTPYQGESPEKRKIGSRHSIRTIGPKSMIPAGQVSWNVADQVVSDGKERENLNESGARLSSEQMLHAGHNDESRTPRIVSAAVEGCHEALMSACQRLRQPGCRVQCPPLQQPEAANQQIQGTVSVPFSLQSVIRNFMYLNHTSTNPLTAASCSHVARYVQDMTKPPDKLKPDSRSLNLSDIEGDSEREFETSTNKIREIEMSMEDTRLSSQETDVSDRNPQACDIGLKGDILEPASPEGQSRAEHQDISSPGSSGALCKIIAAMLVCKATQGSERNAKLAKLSQALAMSRTHYQTGSSNGCQPDDGEQHDLKCAAAEREDTTLTRMQSRQANFARVRRLRAQANGFGKLLSEELNKRAEALEEALQLLMRFEQVVDSLPNDDVAAEGKVKDLIADGVGMLFDHAEATVEDVEPQLVVEEEPAEDCSVDGDGDAFSIRRGGVLDSEGGACSQEGDAEGCSFEGLAEDCPFESDADALRADLELLRKELAAESECGDVEGVCEELT